MIESRILALLADYNVHTIAGMLGITVESVERILDELIERTRKDKTA